MDEMLSSPPPIPLWDKRMIERNPFDLPEADASLSQRPWVADPFQGAIHPYFEPITRPDVADRLSALLALRRLR